MSIGTWVKVNGVWKQVIELYEKSAGTWKKFSEVCIKTDLDTVSPVFPASELPMDLIHMFLGSGTARPKSGQLVSNNLIRDDRFPMIQSSPTTIYNEAGSLDHESHGASSTAYTSYYTHLQSSSFLFGDQRPVITNTSHRHTVAAHTHPDRGTNIPQHVDILPYHKVPKVYQDCLILADPSVGGFTNFTDVTSTYLQSYLRFSKVSTDTNIGSSTHNHGTNSGGVSTQTFSFTTRKQVGSSFNAAAANHSHTQSHTDHSYTPYPSYLKQKLFKADVDMDNLPIGARLFLSTGNVPSDYGIVTGFDDRLILVYTSAGTGGSTTHVHGPQQVYLDYYNLFLFTNNTGTNNTYFTFAASHRHYFTDNHTTARNHMPPSTNLLLVEKLT